MLKTGLLLIVWSEIAICLAPLLLNANFVTPHSSAFPVQHTGPLTFSERLSYQRALETVLWGHRIWPAGNPMPKPPLQQVLSENDLSEKVNDALLMSNALNDHLKLPITGEHLQREMDRMAEYSQDPVMLRQLFAALDNDPYLIAECLARPIVAERCLQEQFLREMAQRPTSPQNTSEKQVTSFGEWWQELRTQVSLEVKVPIYNYKLPNITDGVCRSLSSSTANTLTGTKAEESHAPTTRSNHTAIWTGTEMIIWGGSLGQETFFNTGGCYRPATDSWSATNETGAPSGRIGHSAIWTGTEMIVWGGSHGTEFHYTVFTGGRYNPASNHWQPVSQVNCPWRRERHIAAWTGKRMIIWGGFYLFDEDERSYREFGGIYDPSTDTWYPMNREGSPRPRFARSGIWTGEELVVYGGFEDYEEIENSDHQDKDEIGGRYNPETDTWLPMNKVNAPTPRTHASLVWTGSEVLVWGGYDHTGFTNTGGRYNPKIDSWRLLNTVNAPSPRYLHTSVWTGTEMIVWGGNKRADRFDTGGRFNPVTDRWQPTSTVNSPLPRSQHSAIWTGTEMIIFGGYGGKSFNTCGSYHPKTDSWEAL